MTCPNCGAVRALTARICPRCRFLFEEGRVVGLAAPRARGRKGLRLDPRVRAAWERIRETPRFRVACVVLALFPGLGHVASGRARRGLYVFLAVVGLATVAASYIDLLDGQLLFGTAMAAHAWSILDCTAWRLQPSLPLRAVALILIQLALITVYWPLLQFLSDAFVEPVVYFDEVAPPVGLVPVEVFLLALVLIALLLASQVYLKRRRAA